MKRFITYLYEYERGYKSKNTGFIRVDERKGNVNMQISVRNLIRSHEKGKVYALVGEDSLRGIELGEVGVVNGQGDVCLRFAEQNIMDKEISLDDIVGVTIRFPNNGYLASCWRDEAIEQVGAWEPSQTKQVEVREKEEVKPWIPPQLEELEIQEEFLPQPATLEIQEELLPQPATLEIQEELLPQPATLEIQEEVSPQPEELEMQEELEVQQEQAPQTLVTYKKLAPTQLRALPKKDWYLTNNRFLNHGLGSYGYLVIKKEATPTETVVYLGVPGIYDKPEMVMATLFGFSQFEALPMEIQAAEVNAELSATEISAAMVRDKNQQPEFGTFGCWLIRLHV